MSFTDFGRSFQFKTAAFITVTDSQYSCRLLTTTIPDSTERDEALAGWIGLNSKSKSNMRRRLFERRGFRGEGHLCPPGRKPLSSRSGVSIEYSTSGARPWATVLLNCQGGNIIIDGRVDQHMHHTSRFAWHASNSQARFDRRNQNNPFIFHVLHYSTLNCPTCWCYYKCQRRVVNLHDLVRRSCSHPAQPVIGAD